jgi:NADH-quinone oxidoreductase subunit G
MADHLWVVPMHHIFGSEELSTKSEAIATRIPQPYVLINDKDAVALNLVEGQLLGFEIDGQPYGLPVRTSSVIRAGMAGVPYGLDSLYFAELPAWANIKQVPGSEPRKFTETIMKK